LAGQHADYLYASLKAYQGGNHVVGRGNPTMAAMAKPLSDTELKQIAAFLAELPSELKTVPQSRFR
jgi:cytochrome c553